MRLRRAAVGSRFFEPRPEPPGAMGGGHAPKPGYLDPVTAEIERDTVTLARRIADLGTGRRAGVLRGVVVERSGDGLGDGAAGVQDPAVPLRRRLPGAERRARRRPPPVRVLRRRGRPQGPGSGHRPRRSGPAGRPGRGSDRPPQHHAHGSAVHRRRLGPRGGRRPTPALADRQRLHRRRAGREDRDWHRGRPVRRAGRGTDRGARRCQPPLGPRRPPRARRPRPAASRQPER